MSSSPWTAASLPEPSATAPAVGTLRPATRIHVGDGVRAQVPALVAVHGRRVLVVVDPFLATGAHFIALLEAMEASGLQLRVVTDVVAELPVASLSGPAAAAREHDADVVLGFGGGSALDAAKLVSLLATYGGPLQRFYGENQVPGPVLPVVAVPTTAGTGSEVTPVAVVSDPERELKVGVSSPYLVPVAAIVDPELTHGVPASVTAHSGIDSLVHAVESFTARRLDVDWAGTPPVFTGRNALSDPVSLEAARRLGPWLAVAVREPGNAKARREVALGSLLGGLAFGSTGTHLCHAIQYPLGAMTHTPHGLGTGLMLPYVLDVIREDPEVAGRMATLHAALEGLGPREGTASGLVSTTAELGRQLGLPTSLADIGLDRSALPRVAALTMASSRLVAIAPVDVTPDLVLHILYRAWAGDLTERSDA